MKIIETERLIIREWEENDYKDLFEFASDSEVTKFLHYKTYENLKKIKKFCVGISLQIKLRR